MAKKSDVNKTQAVRDYLKAHPAALSKEIAAALTKQGIEITPGYVANIKVTISKAHASKKAVKKQAAAAPQATPPAAVEKPAKAGDTLTLDQVKKVAQAISTIGGYYRLTSLLEVIRELGGVKKFKDLAEAISVTEPDDIPF